MLVLTDWNMPNKNGLELIQGIRATGSTVPIIMITTESEKARVFSAIEAGVTDYLIKPFDAETLRGESGKAPGFAWLPDACVVEHEARDPASTLDRTHSAWAHTRHRLSPR